MNEFFYRFFATPWYQLTILETLLAMLICAALGVPLAIVSWKIICKLIK